MKRLLLAAALLIATASASWAGPQAQNPPGPIPTICSGGGAAVTTYPGYGQALTCGTGTATGTINSGSSPAILQYQGATSVVAGPATVSGDGTLAAGGGLTITAIGGKAVTLGGAMTTTGTGPITLAYPNTTATFTYPATSKTLMATDFSNGAVGTGVAAALGVNTGTAGSFVVNGGVLGTPSSGVATNLTGLPLTTGVTGILAVANGGSGTATPGLIQGSNITITGSWPNQTINSSGGAGVTWPATNSIVLSNSTNTPAGLAPINGDCVVGAGGVWTAGACGGGGATGFGVDGGASSQSVTGTASIANATRLVKIATGWTTGTLTLPAIANVSPDSAIAIVDGGFVSGSATLTVAANATDTGASGGIISSSGTVVSVGAFTNAGDGLVFRVSGTHTWTVQSAATLASSSAPSNQFATGIGINGLTYAQPSISNISGLGTGVATAAGAALSANGGLTTTIASGSGLAMGTSAIAAGACAAAVQATATNTTTSDVVLASFASDPTATTGYIPSTNGMLTIVVFPTANTANFKVCNNTNASITPGAISLNWRVVR